MKKFILLFFLIPALTLAASHEDSEFIDQSLITKKDFCAGSQEGTDIDKFSRGIFDDDEGVSVNIEYQEKKGDKTSRTPGAYNVYSSKMGKGYSYFEEGVEFPADEMEPVYPQRVYTNSYLGRGKEGSFEIIDSPVRTEYLKKSEKINGRFLSTDMRITQYAFFPRKNVPAIKVAESTIILKLTTGEEITLDKKSGRVISGVAKEVPPKNQIETRTDAKGKNIREFPDTDFVYEGEGLYIETQLTYNLDQKKPGSIVPVKAMVNGKVQECKLKSDDLWKYDFGYYLPQGHEKFLSSSWSCTRYKFERDEDLYQMIKKKCPDFKFPNLAE